MQPASLSASSGITTLLSPYDSLNRLASASETGTGSWAETFGYDEYGNRWVSSASGISLTLETPTSSSWYNSSINRIAGWGYDDWGKVTQVGGRGLFTYDMENRQISATVAAGGGTYKYDGEGRRVISNVGAQTTVYVYEAFGQLAASYGLNTDTGTTYLTADALGSTRLTTPAPLGTPPTGVHNFDYLPFGEDITAGTAGRDSTFPRGYPTTPGQMPLKFTGKERDAESGLDYFGARYFSGAQGRFTSPDKPFADQHMEDPQSWDLYSYTRNNPLKFVDATGTELRLAADATKQDRKDFAAALKYASKDPGVRGIVNTLQQSDTVYAVTIVHNGDDAFDPNTNTVIWDPRSALATEDNDGKLNGGTQSPALGLAHELDHAVGKDQGTTAHGDDPQYGGRNGAEERRVITGSETAAAGTLHEATRTNHGGVPFESRSTTSRKPTGQGNQALRQAEQERGQKKPKYKRDDE
jgi:RHS repeat-associated protein